MAVRLALFVMLVTTITTITTTYSAQNLDQFFNKGHTNNWAVLVSKTAAFPSRFFKLHNEPSALYIFGHSHIFNFSIISCICYFLNSSILRFFTANRCLKKIETIIIKLTF